MRPNFSNLFNVVNHFRSYQVASTCHSSVLRSKDFLSIPAHGHASRKEGHETIQSFLLQKKPLSEASLTELKDHVFLTSRVVNNVNFDSIFVETCRVNNLFEEGKAFFKIVSTQGTNLGCLGKYCRLLFDYKEQCTDEDRAMIVELYKSAVEDYPVLDPNSCENFICGLSLTEEWKEGYRLLEMAKEVSSPTTLMYSALAQGAFNHGDVENGWRTLRDLVKEGKRPPNALITTLFTVCPTKADLLDLLRLFSDFNVHLHPSDVSLIAEHHRKFSPEAAVTSVTSQGICRHCSKPLERLSIGQEEFQVLRDAFLDPVLIGKDIFLKTTPEELTSYQEFLRRVGNVDVVLDGLNVAYSVGTLKGPALFSQMLRDAVHHFTKARKKVMVLGRKHMKSWPKKNMSFIEKNAHVFYAQDISQDDPFLLYGAMWSGIETIFVSRDQMRGHKFLLETPELKRLFSKWQQKNQYFLKYIEKNGTVHFQEPLVYLQDAQIDTHGSCHLPLLITESGIQPQFKHLRTKWLCLPNG